jgi:ferric-dicitrate binding protein FerR (iron transport regulator)
MQISGPVQGVSTIPRRRRLNALLAIVLIAAMVALLVWAGALARSGVGAEDANPKAAGAGSAVIHDDAGTVNRNMGSAIIHDDTWNLKAN